MIPMPFLQPHSSKTDHHEGGPQKSSALQLVQSPEAQPHTFDSSLHPSMKQSPQGALATSAEYLSNSFRGVTALTKSMCKE